MSGSVTYDDITGEFQTEGLACAKALGQPHTSAARGWQGEQLGEERRGGGQIYQDCQTENLPKDDSLTVALTPGTDASDGNEPFP